jgi:hypothetical protein
MMRRTNDGDCIYQLERGRPWVRVCRSGGQRDRPGIQPARPAHQAGKSGGAASIRIDDPNPDIELVETDQVAPAGKYEIAVQSDKLQINGRNATDSEFETVVVFERLAAGGNIGFRTKSQFGAGRGVIAIANAAVAPSVNPADAGVLYVEDGALKYRGSNGTVTVIAAA